MDINARLTSLIIYELITGKHSSRADSEVDAPKFLLSFGRWIYVTIGAIGIGIVPWWAQYLPWVSDQSNSIVRLMFFGVMLIYALSFQALMYRSLILSFDADIEFDQETAEEHYYPEDSSGALPGRGWGLQVNNSGRRPLTECRANLIDIRIENPQGGTMSRWPRRELHWPGNAGSGQIIPGLDSRRLDLFRFYKDRTGNSIIEIAYANMQESDRREHTLVGDMPVLALVRVTTAQTRPRYLVLKADLAAMDLTKFIQEFEPSREPVKLLKVSSSEPDLTDYQI